MASNHLRALNIDYKFQVMLYRVQTNAVGSQIFVLLNIDINLLHVRRWGTSLSDLIYQ